MRSFASDNNSGVHPAILDAIASANVDHAVGYGNDPWTREAEVKIKEVFGASASPFFLFNGTGANCVALRACTRSYSSIIAAESAHIVMDECGAPTFQTGCLVKEVSAPDGKLTPELIKHKLTGFGEVHHSQPQVIYISQCSEYGTVYTPEEVKALADMAHAHNMYLHMDGARLANAAEHLGLGLKEITVDCGVDVLSFGGTKNGMMMGECVISFRPELTEVLGFMRKQSAQLCSKMRYISYPFVAYLSNNLWLENARHANNMTKRLVEGIKACCEVTFTQSVDANIILVSIPQEAIAKLQAKHFFYIWNEPTNEIRLVTSFDTTEEDITSFLADFKAAVTV